MRALRHSTTHHGDTFVLIGDVPVCAQCNDIDDLRRRVSQPGSSHTAALHAQLDALERTLRSGHVANRD